MNGGTPSRLHCLHAPKLCRRYARVAQRLPGVPDRNDRSGLGYAAQYAGSDVAENFPRLRVYFLFKLD